MDALTNPNGEQLYVARQEVDRGSDGPFYAVYRSPDGSRRWGYQCGNCGSLNTAMDTMGRIVCNDCPNVRKPTEWDAAHE
jgi:hypothetical protein